MTAADLLIVGLRQHGVEWLATLCGHGLDPLLNAVRNAGLRLVDVRNEQTCAYMADAFGRLTRRPGVCAVSSAVATVTAGKGHFQDLDQVALARPVAKFSQAIDDAGRTLGILDEAFEAAMADTAGPVHLMFPLDVQETEIGSGETAAASPAVIDRTTSEPDIKDIARALSAAQAPLVIAGSGIFYNGSGDEMLRFCTELRIPLITPIWDRGVVDQPSPVFLGVIGAATGGPAVLGDVDCILLAGAEADYRVGYLQ